MTHKPSYIQGAIRSPELAFLPSWKVTPFVQTNLVEDFDYQSVIHKRRFCFNKVSRLVNDICQVDSSTDGV
jgi:hypothetical protein